jgi:hypothetical protein
VLCFLPPLYFLDFFNVWWGCCLLPLLGVLPKSNLSLVLSMWPCTLKLDHQKSKHTGLGQQNGFGGWPKHFSPVSGG